jgi:hypothetical protein
VLAGCIGLRPDTAEVIGRHVTPAVVYGHVLLKQIAEEPGPLPERTWLRYLTRTVVRDVAAQAQRTRTRASA